MYTYHKILPIFVLLIISNFGFSATYAREGFAYLTATGNYNDTMRLSGTFETNINLINQPFADISQWVTSYSFSDGSQTLTQVNSTIIRFSVETNQIGRISLYDIALRRTPDTNTVGEIVSGIELSFLPSNNFPVGILRDLGFSEPCTATGITFCEQFELTNNYAEYFDGGGVTPIIVPGWTVTLGPEPGITSVPVNNFWFLLLLSLGLVLTVWLLKYFRPKHI